MHDVFNGCCCLQMLASNMTPWEAPPIAGMPFGTNSTRYVALELHYNNPEELTGQKDTGSGIRYTLRVCAWALPALCGATVFESY